MDFSLEDCTCGGTHSLRKIIKKDCVFHLKKYIKKGLEEKDERGRSGLHLASIYGKIKCAKLLIDHGANIEDIDEDGYTPFFIACIKEKIESAKFLIREGANINIQTEYGGCPLHVACIKKNKELVQLLLSHGANVNIAKNGTTAIHYSCWAEDKDIIRLLIEYGANIFLKDDDGKTSLDFTRNREIYDFVIQVYEENILNIKEPVS